MIHDPEAERAVLGCILGGESSDLARVLTPSDFHTPAHRYTWEAMLALFASGQPVDELTVADKLKADGKLEAVGGPSGLMAFTSAAPIGANLAQYVGIVRDRTTRRQLIDNARQIAGKASNLNEDVSAVALGGSAAFAQLGAAGALELPTLEKAFGDFLDDLDAVAKGLKQGAYQTGISIWDELCGGLPAGYLTLIGAYPSVGKSALKNRMLINLARSGVKVGTFELEDPITALVYRLVAKETGIPVRRLRTERLSELLMERVGEVVQREYAWASNVVYENRSGLTAPQLAATARQMVVQRGCKVIFIDHFGEVDFGSSFGRIDFDMEKGIGLVRNVAKELNVAVVGLVHFRRPKDSDREPRYLRPTSGIWKNSGGYEQASRLAVGLWLEQERPGHVNATVLKQTEGEKDFDFVMPLHQPSGLIESTGGRTPEGTTGYSEGKDSQHWSDS